MEFRVDPETPLTWEQVIKTRLQKGQVIGRSQSREARAILAYDAYSNRFALSLRLKAFDQTELFDCEMREQGGLALVFLQLNPAGRSMAVGHAILRSRFLYLKLKAGYAFDMEVNLNEPCLRPLMRRGPSTSDRAPEPHDSAPGASAAKNRFPSLRRRKEQDLLPVVDGQAAEPTLHDEDFSAADLKRLRGEVEIHSRKRY